MARTDGGLYVHVPYCRHRCHFCAFKITTHLDTLAEWTAGVLAESDLRAPEWPDRFDTVYFGGGTPSAVPPVAIVRVLDRIRDRLDVADDAEVSLEANPGNLDRDGLAELRRAGVNRLSLGIQSLQDDALALLTRDHSAADGVASFRDARAAGFANITVDVMYGLPGRSRERLVADLDAILALGPDHVSAYQLTIEPGTPFAADRRRGRLTPLSPEVEREVFLLVHRHLAAADWRPYEVSSFARAPAFESRHNHKYWSGAPYLGVGPAAHSFRDPVRTENHPGVRAWAAALAAGEDPAASRESLTPEARTLERLFLGLRTVEGIDLDDFPGLAGARADLIERLVAEGSAVLANGRLSLTPEGLALADGIAVALAD